MNSLLRTPEFAFFAAVEAVLFDAGGKATISYVRRRIPSYIQLTGADQAPSTTRPGEQLWEQQVRNIVCHRTYDDNPIKVGKFIYTKGYLSLANPPQGDLFDNDNFE